MKPDKDEIVNIYYPTIRKIVRKLVVKMPEGFDEDDFVQVGMLGLLKAIDNWDSEKSLAEFKSYANTKIRGAILDKIRNVDHVSRYTRDRMKKISQSYKLFMDKGIFNPSDEDLAKESNLNMDEYNKIMNDSSNLTMLSIDKVVSDSDMLVIESIESKKFDNPLEEIEKQEKGDLIKEGLKKLSKMEQTVLSLYYYEEFNIREIASVIGKTESRVSQIKTKALIKLREFVKRSMKNE